MVRQICEAISEHGYIVTPYVGRSNFKIDIAVSSKDNPDRYILGILCDGRSYYETKTTRDREIVQPTVMKMLGWHVMRVYSVDWYENRERCISQILEELKACERGEANEEEATGEAPLQETFSAEAINPTAILQEPLKNQGQMPYIETEVPTEPKDTASSEPDKVYKRVVSQIISTEQPITENYLCKRVARMLGYAHAGTNIQRAVLLAAKKYYRDPLSLGGVSTLWLDEASSKDYRSYRAPSPRNISEIPLCEVVNAVREVIFEEFSLPKEKIPTIAARKLGFSSAGAKIAETVYAALDIMLRQGDVRDTNGMLSLNNE
jgi:hypothetical protein